MIDPIYVCYASRQGKSRWGVKSDYLDRMDLINYLFPDAKFIHIIRDGRDIVHSVIERSGEPNNITQAAECWNSHLLLGRRMGAILGEDRYIEVRF